MQKETESVNYFADGIRLMVDGNQRPQAKEGDSMNIKQCFAIGGFAVALSALGISSMAADAVQDDGGIQSTAVARLKIGKGTAWVRTGDSGEWEEAVTNYTVSDRSRISVPEGSEAEIQFRGSQSLVLGGGAEVDIGHMGEEAVSYRLRSGQVDLSLPKEDFAPVRMTVPGNREVRVGAPGRYTLSTSGGSTTFLVRAGEGAVTGEKGPPIVVKAGEEASIGKEIQVSRAGSAVPEMVPEEQPLTEAEQNADVPPAVAGELRQYGEWVSTPEYGNVWRPYVDDGWEPYYYGRWAWVEPYGWTWVGYEPWGWWPYHAGWWWPSPVFGWVWCPFHSFVSFNFFFGSSVFTCHNARFFPGNVRFIGRGQFVRWVPARPGETASRAGSFSRSDTRLTAWNRPVERGSVMVRRDGGRPMAWEGREGVSHGAMNRKGTGMPRMGSGGSSVPRINSGGAVRGRQGNNGIISQSTRREGMRRTPAVGGGSASGSFGRYGGTAPASSTTSTGAPVTRPGGAFGTGFANWGSRGFGGGGFRGSAGGR
jgi:hypothetical protein